MATAILVVLQLLMLLRQISSVPIPHHDRHSNSHHHHPNPLLSRMPEHEFPQPHPAVNKMGQEHSHFKRNLAQNQQEDPLRHYPNQFRPQPLEDGPKRLNKYQKPQSVFNDEQRHRPINSDFQHRHRMENVHNHRHQPSVEPEGTRFHHHHQQAPVRHEYYGPELALDRNRNRCPNEPSCRHGAEGPYYPVPSRQNGHGHGHVPHQSHHNVEKRDIYENNYNHQNPNQVKLPMDQVKDPIVQQSQPHHLSLPITINAMKIIYSDPNLNNIEDFAFVIPNNNVNNDNDKIKTALLIIELDVTDVDDSPEATLVTVDNEGEE